MRIADIRDPNLFQRLVRRLYVAERGHDFQLVDDSGGDAGNDGYDPVRRLLYSIYCPEKPDSARFKRKGLDDLKKAVTLRTTRGYDIEGWVFVTPDALREPVQRRLREEANKRGLRAAFESSEHLEDLYRRHPHLHDDFPELEYPRVAEQLREIKTMLAGQPTGSPPQSLESGSEPATATRQPHPGPQPLFGGFISPTLSDIAQRLAKNEPQALPELERFRLEAVDPRDAMAATMLELEHARDIGDPRRVLDLAAAGKARADAAGAVAEQAMFTAELAYYTTLQLVQRDFEIVATVHFSNLTGAPLITQEQLSSADRDLSARLRQVDDWFREAVEAAVKSGNLLAIYSVFLRKGSAATQRAFPHLLTRGLGANARASASIDTFRQEMVRSYEVLIPVAKALSTPDRLATAYSNYANDLVVFGDYERAGSHAQHALELARAAGDAEQVAKTEALLNKIARERPTNDHKRAV